MPSIEEKRIELKRLVLKQMLEAQKQSSEPQDLQTAPPATAESSALFPSASKIKGQGLGKSAARIALGVTDVLDAPKRFGGVLRGGSMEDPRSTIWAPERDKIQHKIDQSNLPDEFSPTPMYAGSSPIMPPMTKGMLKGAVEVGADILGDPLLMGSFVRKTVGKIGKAFGLPGPSKLAGALAEEVGQVPEEGLRMWMDKDGRETLKKAYGKELPTAQEMVERVYNETKYLPENAQVEKIINTLPPIKTDNVIAALESAKTKNPIGVNVRVNEAITKLQEEILQKKYLPDTKRVVAGKTVGEEVLIPGTTRVVSGKTVGEELVIPASTRQTPSSVINPGTFTESPISGQTITTPARKIGGVSQIPGQTITTPARKIGEVSEIPGQTITTKGKAVTKNEYLPADEFRELRKQLDREVRGAFDKDYKEGLEQAIIKARTAMAKDLVDNAPPEYKELMAQYAGKLQTIDGLKSLLGNHKDKATQKAFTLLRTVDNESRQPIKEIVKKYDEVFGTQYAKRAEEMHLARQIGKPGKDALELPILPKGATGNRLWALLTVGLGSPRIAPKMLGALDALENADVPMRVKTLQTVPINQLFGGGEGE